MTFEKVIRRTNLKLSITMFKQRLKLALSQSDLPTWTSSSNLKFRASVAVVFSLDKEKTLRVCMMKRASHPGDLWSGNISFPGGKQDRTDQSDYHTLVRECLEELGLDIEGSGFHCWGCLSPEMFRIELPQKCMIVRPFVFWYDHGVEDFLAKASLADEVESLGFVNATSIFLDREVTIEVDETSRYEYCLSKYSHWSKAKIEGKVWLPNLILKDIIGIFNPNCTPFQEKNWKNKNDDLILINSFTIYGLTLRIIGTLQDCVGQRRCFEFSSYSKDKILNDVLHHSFGWSQILTEALFGLQLKENSDFRHFVLVKGLLEMYHAAQEAEKIGRLKQRKIWLSKL